MNESYFSLLEQGLLIGLAGAASVGPMSIFCIQRTITKGIISGFMASIGAATAMAILASIGLASLNLISTILVHHKELFCIVAGLLLCYLGAKIFGDKLGVADHQIHSSERLVHRNRLLTDYGAALLLNIVNPLSILPFMASFVQVYSADTTPSYALSGMFVAGVFISTAAWYGLLSCGVNLLPQRMLFQHLKWINRISGAAIAAIGCVYIYSIRAG
jgi:threonine/homoserine/homoserine lactone efflux protein